MQSKTKKEISQRPSVESPSMSLGEFLGHLQNVTKMGLSRMEWTSGPRMRLVSEHPVRKPYLLKYCPITAVCAYTTGVHHFPSDAAIAAEVIGLPLDIANIIIRAADKSGGYSYFIRQALEAAIRLGV